ncbi:MAG TPA: helix-turn-helix domain-containing protein [Stellaceae bacterium]|nr:helix-turn-helix domain-containing protein [Stellaceae bacterium]
MLLGDPVGLDPGDKRPGRDGVVSWACQRFTDVDEQAASLAGFDIRCDQLGRGKFEGERRSLMLSDKTCIFIESANRSMRIRARWPVARYHVAILPETGVLPPVDLDGTLMAPSDLMLTPPGIFNTEHIGGPLRYCWISVDQDSCLAEPDFLDGDAVAAELSIVAAAQHAGLFRQIVAEGERQFAAAANGGANAQARAGFERTLMAMVAWTRSAAAPAARRDAGIRAQHRARLLRRAREIIEGRLADGLTMPELCQELGMSRRSMESLFTRQLGLSPYEYVRALRFNALRRALRAEENAGRPIADVAGERGFWHLSALAADYRRMFGVLPSADRRL